MIVFDTNVVVRLLTNDDAAQASRAAALLAREQVLIPLSVILETEWVLRSVYGLERGRVVHALRGLFGISSVSVEAASRVGQALAWYEDGFDFADALHLAGATDMGADRIATFDGSFIRQANAGSTAVQAIEP